MEDKSEEKKRKLSKHSVGNQHKFNQQLPKKSTTALNKISSELTLKEDFLDISILNQIESLANCCPIGREQGCCLKHFVDENTGLVDFEKAVSYVKNCRVPSKRCSNHDDRDPIIINIFKSCIQDDSIRGNERIFKMDYQIPSPRNLLGRDNSVKCCRAAILTIVSTSGS